MKKFSILLLIMCYFVSSLSFAVFATDLDTETETTVETTVSTELPEQQNAAVNSGSYSLDALNPMLGSSELTENMRAAIVYEANSQTLLYTWNPDVQMYPASLVKIMTALVAAENAPMESLATVNQSALEGLPVDATVCELVVNEVIPLYDLIHFLLIGSANDAANVIAEHVGGSQSGFVEMMNEHAKKLGCTATHFTNASGLHDENQHTTARDIAKILDAALKNDAFKEIFTKFEYLVPATNMSPERRVITSSSIQNTTSRLYYDSRVTGSRTAVTNDGKRCLAVSAESNGMLIVCVVMGSETVYQEDGYSAISVGGYQETTLLLDTCLTGNKTAQILSAGQVLRQMPVEGAKNHLIVGPKVSASTVLPEDMTAEGLTYQYTDKQLTLPIMKDQHVGDVSIWNGSMCVAQAELYAMNTVEAADVVSGDTDSDGNAILWILLIIVVVAVLAFVGVRYSGKIRRLIRIWRRKRRRQGRKRAR